MKNGDNFRKRIKEGEMKEEEEEKQEVEDEQGDK